MRRRKNTLVVGVTALLVVSAAFFWATPAQAGCTLRDICADVMSSLLITKTGEAESNIQWETGSESNDLEYYKIVRSEDPGNGSWVTVETVDPAYECSGTPAEYWVIEEDAPVGNWTYAVQVYSETSLVCTIVDN